MWKFKIDKTLDVFRFFSLSLNSSISSIKFTKLRHYTCSMWKLRQNIHLYRKRKIVREKIIHLFTLLNRMLLMLPLMWAHFNLHQKFPIVVILVLRELNAQIVSWLYKHLPLNTCKTLERWIDRQQVSVCWVTVNSKRAIKELMSVFFINLAVGQLLMPLQPHSTQIDVN